MRSLMHDAGTSAAANLEAKCAERDELLHWLDALADEGASPEAVAVVQGQLERVIHAVARLKGLEAAGFSPPATAER